jgi:hypothetical protein
MALKPLSHALEQAEIIQEDMAQRAVDSVMAEQSWPADAAGDVSKFVRANAPLLQDDHRYLQGGFKNSKAFNRRFDSDDDASQRADALRSAIGLPPA